MSSGWLAAQSLPGLQASITMARPRRSHPQQPLPATASMHPLTDQKFGSLLLAVALVVALEVLWRRRFASAWERPPPVPPSGADSPMEARSTPRGSRKRLVPMRPLAVHCLLGPAILLLGGCLSHSTALEPPAVSLVVIPCDHIELTAQPFDLQGTFHLHGTVRARGLASNHFGRIAVDVREPTGRLWAQSSISYQLQHRLRRDPGPDFINMSLAGLPPPGSIVELRHFHAPTCQ